jgi:hypothetical protein
MVVILTCAAALLLTATEAGKLSGVLALQRQASMAQISLARQGCNVPCHTDALLLQGIRTNETDINFLRNHPKG